MGFVQCRGSTQTKAKLLDQQTSQMKHTYLSQVSGMVKVHKIPPELVLKWDQAGVKLVPSQNWTMEEQGSSCVEIAGINDKCQISNFGWFNVCHSNFSMRGKLFVVTHTTPIHLNLMCGTSPIIGLTRRLLIKAILLYVKAVWAKNNTSDQGALVIFNIFKGHTGEAANHCWKRIVSFML